MLRHLFSILFCIPIYLTAQEDLPFQVLVAEGATIYGKEVKPLQFIDDVTSVEVKEGGLLSLVHKGGTTYELTEKIFTFYLKPEELKDRAERPNLNVLYQDTLRLEQSRLIKILHPPFDRTGFLVWNEDEPFEFYWHLHEIPVLVYVITVSDGEGNKIQDFRTKKQEYILKPSTYGLENATFMVQLSNTFDGKSIDSKRFQIQLVKAPVYEKKASDLVIKALDLELSPTMALATWKQVLEMPNGEFYKELFQFFLVRNTEVLTAAGEDVELLLSQNK